MARRALILAAAAALLGTGCGNKEAETTKGDTEGIWIDAGPLDYHIQGSRQLNPGIVPDDEYLNGVPEGYAQPKADETWFAVFVRIENKTDAEAPTAAEFEIEDTEGNLFEPVPLDTKRNAFAYVPTALGPRESIPFPDSIQELDSPQGAMLLFKIPLVEFQNRPLEFTVHAPDGAEPAEASVDLDV